MVGNKNIRTVVVTGLKEYLGIPVIRANQNAEPPKYPYLSYTVTITESANNGTWGEYDDGIDRIPVTQTWSITVQSDKDLECVELASKAREYLTHYGRTYLNDNNVVVAKTTNITNRDNILTIEYEYRNGFDVVFNMMNEEMNPALSNDYVGIIKRTDLKREE